jgi:hypothetical protein
MANSADVSSGDLATAAQYNNLRADVLNTSSGHSHTGTDSKNLGTLTGAITVNQTAAPHFSFTGNWTLANHANPYMANVSGVGMTLGTYKFNVITNAASSTGVDFSIDNNGHVNIANGSLEVATIDYTDGDLAMTIADGGDVTFAEDIHFADGHYFYMGNDDDLRMNHSGSNAAMKNFNGVMYFQYDDSGTSRKAISYDQSGNTWLYHADSAVLKTISGGVEIVGSLEVATIDYTDGDLAMTIANGGGVTFAQNMTVPNIEVGDGGYIRFGGDYPMIDDNGYLQIRLAANQDMWWTNADGANIMQLDADAYQLSIGKGQAADSSFVLDGNAIDFYIGLDDSADKLKIGTGTTIGSNMLIQVDANDVYFNTHVKPSGDAGHSLGSSSFGWANLYLTDTGASAAEGPTLQMRSKSASPADNDKFGVIQWIARNTAGIDHEYVKIEGRTQDVTEATEDGRLDFNVYLNGTSYLTAGLWNNDLHLLRNLEMNYAATAQDSMIWWDGNAQDFYIGLDDNVDNLVIGTGATVGSDPVISITNAGAQVLLDTEVIYFQSSDSYRPRLVLRNSNSDTTGAYLDFLKETTDEADGDFIGVQRFLFANTAAEITVAATIYSQSVDVTDSTEDGNLVFQTMQNGTQQNNLKMDATGNRFSLDTRIHADQSFTNRSFIMEEVRSLTNITAYATILTLTPSAVTNVWTQGLVYFEIGGHTSGVDNGSRRGYRYFNIANAAPGVGDAGSDIYSTNAPEFRIATNNNDILLQVQSQDGSNRFDGTLYVKILCPQGAGSAGTSFTYTLS